TTDSQCPCLVAENKTATGSLVGHDDLCLTRLSRAALHFSKQPRSACSRIHKSKSLAFFTIHRDSRHRVLVSKIDSHENMLLHRGQSPLMVFGSVSAEPN